MVATTPRAYNCLGPCCIRCFYRIEPLLPLLVHTSPSDALLYPHTQAAITPTHTHYKVASLHICVGWRGSFSCAGARYWTAITGLSVGVVAWMPFSALGEYEHGAPMPSVPESLSIFTRKILPPILRATFTISHLSLSRDYVS
ncbi:hypothetical protein EDB86DRAFT_647354 [Lactarius hatsudake]|nr:hypothetical protein EDB86DRAFT_647354 [Lactarius hatsudake]